MNTVQVNVNVGLSGSFKGTSDNPDRRSPLGLTAQQAMTQGGTGATFCNQAIDLTKVDQTVAGATTVNLDLRNPGATVLNPLGEQITSTNSNQFAKVRVLRFQHSSGSTAASGIRLFASTTDSFQGLLATGDSLTLKPGESITLESYTVAGMGVDATHRNFTYQNLDANPAQFRTFIGGSTN